MLFRRLQSSLDFVLIFPPLWKPEAKFGGCWLRTEVKAQLNCFKCATIYLLFTWPINSNCFKRSTMYLLLPWPINSTWTLNCLQALPGIGWLDGNYMKIVSFLLLAAEQVATYLTFLYFQYIVISFNIYLP